MELTLVDIIVLSVIGISALVSLVRGLIRELLSIAGLILSGMLTIMLFDPARKYMETQVDSDAAAAAIAGVGLFLFFALFFAILNIFIVKYIHSSGLSLLDRSLGVLFGLLRGAFLVCLCFMVVDFLMDEEQYPDPLKEAKTLETMKWGADYLKELAPDYTKQLENVSNKAKEDAIEKAKERAAEEANGQR